MSLKTDIAWAEVVQECPNNRTLEQHRVGEGMHHFVEVGGVKKVVCEENPGHEVADLVPVTKTWLKAAVLELRGLAPINCS